jgi:hypothetical protein
MSAPDLNLISFAGRRPLGEHVVGDVLAGPERSDALKVTDCANGRIAAGHIRGGKEDCVDVNNHTTNVVIEAALFEPRGKHLATIKGGSGDITLRGKVRGHGSVVDIDLGNIADQSDNVTGRVRLDLVHEAGEPITVRILGAIRPTLLNSHEQRYEVVFALPGFWRSLFLKACKFLKKIGLPI